jgi:hypothetical protein
MIENGIGVCRCLFNCSSEKNQVKEKSFFKKINSVFILRSVRRMGWSIEIHAKWNMSVVSAERILYKLIIPTVNSLSIFLI